LQVAVEIGHFELVRCMVNELGFDINQASTTDGATLLLKAIWLGNLDMVRFLQ
jgi:ankyrin repeat protein